MKLLFITLFAFSGIVFPAQAQINRLDEGGKKHGRWKMYLDDIWKETEDTANAKYIRYTVYEHGTNLFSMGPCGRKGWTLESEGSSKSKLLDGEYVWKKTNGQVSSKHKFKNGEYIYAREYSNMGDMKQDFDYVHKYNGDPNTWSVTVYKSSGEKKFFIFRKGDNYWNLYPGSENDVK